MDSTEYPTFRRQLVRWYARHARDLPWRRTTDPYPIWISEIMLQQTTVTAVIPYFLRFLERFPTIRHLANSDETEVLRHWEGLGYYSRARNLRKAAIQIVEHNEGIFPDDLETLRSLPGIGRYTAGAIASFAFDRRAPIVEANTLRLYCRLLGYNGDPRSTEGQTILWTFAKSILPKAAAGRLNQALMELGATVCLPRDPHCDVCPVRQHCAAFHDGTQSTVPRPKTRIAITDVMEASIAIKNGRDYLLRKRSVTERWAGLWDFVRIENRHRSQTVHVADILEAVSSITGLSVDIGAQVAEFKHAVTRYRITLKCFIAKRIGGRLRSGEEWQWVRPQIFDEYPLSVTGRQFAEVIKRLP